MADSQSSTMSAKQRTGSISQASENSQTAAEYGFDENLKFLAADSKT